MLYTKTDSLPRPLQRTISPNLQPVTATLFALLLTSMAATHPVAAATPSAQSSTSATSSPNKDGAIVGDDNDGQAPALKANATPQQRATEAWTLLTDASKDPKHPQTRIQALAAIGLLRSQRAEKLLSDGMNDADLDVRTAAVLAAGQSKDRNLTTDMRARLDDKEPQVAFTAATTLWSMGDHSGEDILMAVVDGDRSASPDLVHGTEHTISRELHNPADLARIGAMQGASMLLGPFGFGITAYEYIRKNGGDLSRVHAIELLSEEKTRPIHQELIAALGDKDPTVRAAAAKALVPYRDNETSKAVYALLQDPRYPVRLTAAASYLRTTGTPGPDPDLPSPHARPAHEVPHNH
jgi:hypothetical protein